MGQPGWLESGEKIEIVSKPAVFRTIFLMCVELFALLAFFIWLIAYAGLLAVVAIEIAIMLLAILSEFAPMFHQRIAVRLEPIFEVDRAMATYYFTDRRIVRASFLFTDSVRYEQIGGVFMRDGLFQRGSGIYKLIIEPRENFLSHEIFTTGDAHRLLNFLQAKVEENKRWKSKYRMRKGIETAA